MILSLGRRRRRSREDERDDRDNDLDQYVVGSLETPLHDRLQMDTRSDCGCDEKNDEASDKDREILVRRSRRRPRRRTSRFGIYSWAILVYLAILATGE